MLVSGVGSTSTAVVSTIPIGSPADPTSRARSPGRRSPSMSQSVRKELVAACHREQGAELTSVNSPVAPASVGRGSATKSSNLDSVVEPTATCEHFPGVERRWSPREAPPPTIHFCAAAGGSDHNDGRRLKPNQFITACTFAEAIWEPLRLVLGPRIEAVEGPDPSVRLAWGARLGHSGREPDLRSACSPMTSGPAAGRWD